MISGFRRRSAAASVMATILLAATAVLGATAAPAFAAAGDTTRVSVDGGGNEGNGQAFDNSTSGDGRYVAFSSDASNLVPADTNAAADVFVHDRQTGAVERVNVDGSGNQANDFGAAPSISADGRFVAFSSLASNLVAGDTNGLTDVFVHDRQTGATERVSVGSAGAEGNRPSQGRLSISADGRFVAFSSRAFNFVAGDTPIDDVFVHDRQTGTTERVSVDSAGAQGNESSLAPSISADGRFVAFYSTASNLVPADTNTVPDAFVHDRQTGAIERVSVDGSGNQGNGQSHSPSISADGRFVAFSSDASNIVTGDTNSTTDVFVHDLQTGAAERVSVDSNGNQARGLDPAISADGRFVAFLSGASNLVAGDTNATLDIFLRDRQFGTTERVSVSGSGTEANGQSGFFSSLSANGRVVAFLSSASNLVPGDTNGVTDVFVHELSTDVTRPSISITAPLDGSIVSGTIDVSANASDDVGIAGVQFKLDGANLGPEDTTPPYAVAWDTTTVANVSHRLTAVARDGAGQATTSEVVSVGVNNPLGATERVSVDSSGNESERNSFSTFSSISGDGRFVAFSSSANNLAAGDFNGQSDVFVHDRQTHATERVSVDSSGNGANSFSTLPSISADGRFVAFSSPASNLAPGDTNATSDIFVHDRQTGATERVSVDGSGIGANSESSWPSISADGRFVAFHSSASNLVAGDTNPIDVFVHDRQTGATERVSVEGSGNQANSLSEQPSISADGRFVAFNSFASNLVAGDTNGARDVFVHDRQTGSTERVSVDGAGTQGNGSSPGDPPVSPSISADGRFVAFHSAASNLVAGDTNSASDVFVHDRQTGSTERMSVDGSGNEGNGNSQKPSISPDGRVVSFESGASNLVSGDTNAAQDVFVHDRQTGATERVSVGGFGGQANGFSFQPSVSADGSFVAFSSSATNLTPGDNNASEDVFVHELDTTPPSISVTAPADGSTVSGTTSLTADASDNVRIAGVQFRLDDAAFGDEDTSAPYSVDWDTTAITNDTHTLSAVASDSAGNSTTSAEVSVTVSNDVSAPVVNIDSTPPDPTNDNTPTIAFSANEPATFQCSLTKGADSFESCESPKTYSAQVDGLYTFKVKATDDAGNPSEAIVYSFEIDATPPAAPSAPDLDAASDTGLSNSDNETSDVTPTFSGTAEAGSTVTILVDGIERGSGVASSTYSITTDALSLGDHVVVARVEDAAGNVSAQSGPLTVRIVNAPCNAPNRIVGNERPNLLVGTAGGDVMLGLGSTDALFGLGGADCLSGGAGNDILATGSGDDESMGGDGRDYIDPGPGRDLVSGGSGDDTVDARDGAVDHIDCGSGTKDAATVDRIDQVTGCEKVSRGR